MSLVHKVNKNGWGVGRGGDHTLCAAVQLAVFTWVFMKIAVIIIIM